MKVIFTAVFYGKLNCNGFPISHIEDGDLEQTFVALMKGDDCVIEMYRGNVSGENEFPRFLHNQDYRYEVGQALRKHGVGMEALVAAGPVWNAWRTLDIVCKQAFGILGVNPLEDPIKKEAYDLVIRLVSSQCGG